MGAGDHRAYRRLAMFLKSDVLLLPLVFTIVASSGHRAVCRGSNGRRLIVTHCFLPPRPAYRYCDNFEGKSHCDPVVWVNRYHTDRDCCRPAVFKIAGAI